MEFLDRLGLQRPVVQAGMGGGISTGDLAGAVSAAGGLGTVGLLPDSARMVAELERARDLARGRPLAANLLLPFARLEHAAACVEGGADLVVLFCGSSPRFVEYLRSAGLLVFQQVGTVDEARQAIADGVDGLVAQGLEAGGHLLGTEPIRTFLPKALEVADGRPVMAAGGVATGAAANALIEQGAAAVVAGTRFLLTEECRAHPGYKRRVLEAEKTLETRLFSVGWPDRHRVVPNAVTDRWCSRSSAGPRAVVAANRALAPLMRALPSSAATATLKWQRAGVPFYGPAAALEGMDDALLDVTPLYAGECAREIESVITAAQAVELLDPS